MEKSEITINFSYKKDFALKKNMHTCKKFILNEKKNQ